MSLPDIYTLVFHEWARMLPIPGSQLHIHAGLAILVCARLLLGLSFRSLWMIAIVCLAALAKELADWIYHGEIKPDSFTDIINTVGWPVAIVLAARLRSPPLRDA